MGILVSYILWLIRLIGGCYLIVYLENEIVVYDIYEILFIILLINVYCILIVLSFKYLKIK